MLDWLFIMLFILAIIFLIISVTTTNPFWILSALALASAVFLILGIGIINIETEYVVYNVSSNQVEEGIHSYTSAHNTFISWLFTGIALILLMYLFIRAFETYKEFKGWK